MNTLTPFHLTPLGTFHTAISLIAVVAGVIAFVRDKKISPKNLVGRIYVTTTVITCLTGFGIFQHGGFGKPHVLGVAAVAGNSRLFCRGWPFFGTISYSATFFFHIVPGITQTSVRLPPWAPLVGNADAPAPQVATGGLFSAFHICA